MNAVVPKQLAAVSLVAFDVDGVFTDGLLHMSDDGSETKTFHTQDGFGIRRLLDAGIEVAVSSGRNSAAVERRMKERGITHVDLLEPRVRAEVLPCGEEGCARGGLLFRVRGTERRDEGEQ